MERINKFNYIAALWIICGWEQVCSLLWSIFLCLLRNNYIKVCLTVGGDHNAMHSRFSCLSFFLPPKMFTNRNYRGTTSNMLSPFNFRNEFAWVHVPVSTNNKGGPTFPITSILYPWLMQGILLSPRKSILSIPRLSYQLHHFKLLRNGSNPSCTFRWNL